MHVALVDKYIHYIFLVFYQNKIKCPLKTLVNKFKSEPIFFDDASCSRYFVKSRFLFLLTVMPILKFTLLFPTSPQFIKSLINVFIKKHLNDFIKTLKSSVVVFFRKIMNTCTRKNSEKEVESKNKRKLYQYRKIFLGFCFFQGRSANFLLLCSQWA